MTKLTLLDVDIKVTLDGKTGHFWDKKTFNKAGRPVALCGVELFPRQLIRVMTPSEMKKVPFCTTCLSLVEKS